MLTIFNRSKYNYDSMILEAINREDLILPADEVSDLTDCDLNIIQINLREDIRSEPPGRRAEKLAMALFTTDEIINARMASRKLDKLNSEAHELQEILTKSSTIVELGAIYKIRTKKEISAMIECIDEESQIQIVSRWLINVHPDDLIGFISHSPIPNSNILKAIREHQKYGTTTKIKELEQLITARLKEEEYEVEKSEQSLKLRNAAISRIRKGAT